MLLIDLYVRRKQTNPARGYPSANTFGPAGRARKEHSYLDNGYRIDERRTGDSSQIREEKGDKNHRENHRAEGDLEIREDSIGEEPIVNYIHPRVAIAKKSAERTK